jgi:copper(I)-binding protein
MYGRFATAFAAAFALVSCGSGESGAPRVTAEHAVVTLPAAAGRPGAAYFQLETNRAARLVSVTSPSARRIELHEEGMRPAAAFELKPDAPLHFRPGGRHAMLFELDPALRPGGKVTLTFTFEGGPGPVTVEADLRAPGDVPTHH